MARPRKHDRQAPLKNYCKGLLLPGERKSMEPMAAHLDPAHIQPMRQSLHHLVAKAPWSDEVLLEQVRSYVLPTMQKQGPVVASLVNTNVDFDSVALWHFTPPQLHCVLCHSLSG